MSQPLRSDNGHAAASVGAVVIPLPQDDELSPELVARLAQLPPLNVTRMFARTDDMFASLTGLAGAVFAAKGVDVKLRELIVLRVAHLLRAPYEAQANTIMAKNVGVTDAQLAAVGQDGPVQGLDEEATLICQATDELTQQSTLADATLQALLARYGPGVTTKYIALIGWFNMLSMILNATRVPLETDLSKLQGRTSPG